MENFRSKSCKDGGGGGGMMQMESHYGGGGGGRGMHDLMRSYSTSHASSSVPPSKLGKELKIKKIKNPNYEKNSSSSSSSTSTSTVAGSKNWGLNDPELQRMKRVASYKVYALEGKMKGSFRKSFRWIKHTCNHVVYGWW